MSRRGEAITLYLDTDVISIISTIAQGRDTSVSRVVNEIIKEYFSQPKLPNNTTSQPYVKRQHSKTAPLPTTEL